MYSRTLIQAMLYIITDEKSEIANAEILTPFEPKNNTIITADASTHGIGAVLTQIKKDVEKPFAFASRSLSQTERNYAVIEREALAAAWGVEYFRTYLWVLQFVLRTDHKLKVQMKLQSARFASSLQEYWYHLEHVAGWKNVQADCLSRLLLGVLDEGRMEEELVCVVTNIEDALEGEFKSINQEKWAAAAKMDGDLKDLVRSIHEGWKYEGDVRPPLRGFLKCKKN